MSLIIGTNDTIKIGAGRAAVWPLKISAGEEKVKISFEIATGPDGEDAPDWAISLYNSAPEYEPDEDVDSIPEDKRRFSFSTYEEHDPERPLCVPNKGEEIWNDSVKKNVHISVPSSQVLSLEVICPKGARYGDYVSVTMKVETDDGMTDTKEYTAYAKQSIVVLTTQIDQEKVVVDSLAAKANIGEKDIYAILSPVKLRGYVLVEGMNTDRMHDKKRDIKKARKFIDGEMKISNIEKAGYLTPLSTVVGIVEGDLVELVNGPFKGEKARVSNIDQAKEEITVELVGAMVPIPVTVKGDSVRIIEKEK